MSKFSAVSFCKNFIYLRSAKGAQTKLSNIWLRENSLHPSSFDAGTFQKIHDPAFIDVNVHPKAAQLQNNPDALHVTWSDGHQSNHPLEWIVSNVLERDVSAALPRASRCELWGSEQIKAADITFDYEDLLNNPKTLDKFMEVMIKYGIVYLTDSPKDPSSCQKVAMRIGDIMQNREYRDKANPHYELQRDNWDDFDIAYSGYGIPLHTDNNDMVQPAGLMTVQVVEQSKIGGESRFADGYRAAELLKEKDPKAFEILSTWPVNHRLHNNYFVISPIIELYSHLLAAKSGLHELAKTDVLRVRISQANISHWQPCIPQEDMKEWYTAMKTFRDILDAPENCLEVKLQPETMAVYDNFRVLHSRTGFKGRRRLQGIFVPYDDFMAKYYELIGARGL